MHAIYSTAYLDRLSKCYYNILVVSPTPMGNLRNMTKQIQLPNLTGVTNCGNCPPSSECMYAFLSINNPTELMQLIELPSLFSELQTNGYTVNSDLTKMLIKTGITQTNKTLLCYIVKN